MENDIKQNKNTENQNDTAGLHSSPLDCYPPVLDACCGPRCFWFDKSNPNVLFADCRTMSHYITGTGKNARVRSVVPDREHDFRDMDYPHKTFNMVVFDPPHLFVGEKSYMAKIYGRLDKSTWQDDLKRGFSECFRVLKTGGFLIFKWNSSDIPLRDILTLTPEKPMFGHPSGKAQKTHWICFMKVGDNV